jgi:transposase
MQTEIIPKDQQFYPFLFQHVHLKESCWIENTPYFTRRAIGEWLEYPNPKQAIQNIIKRNPHIEDPRWSSVLKMRTELATGKQGDRLYKREDEIEIYNPIGLQLIVFESHQPKAKAYKIAVANLVWAFMQGKLTMPSEATPRGLIDIALIPRHTKERMAAQKELARDLNVSISTVRRYIKRCENNAPFPRKPMMRGYTWSKNKEKRERVERIHKLCPRMKKKNIALKTGVHISTVYRWLNKLKRAAQTP